MPLFWFRGDYYGIENEKLYLNLPIITTSASCSELDHQTEQQQQQQHQQHGMKKQKSDQMIVTDILINHTPDWLDRSSESSQNSSRGGSNRSLFDAVTAASKMTTSTTGKFNGSTSSGLSNLLSVHQI